MQQLRYFITLIVSRILGLYNAVGLRKSVSDPQFSRPLPMHEGEIVTLSESIPGWLNPPASLVTIHLLSILPDGPAMEIGVYQGKYLSVIRACLGPACRIVGYDLFGNMQQKRIQAEFEKLFKQSSNLELIALDSTRLTPAVVLKDCGRAPVFVSVDGSHEVVPVVSDLNLTDKVLDEAGVVAVDDVLNPLALGVAEGLGRFLMSEPRLVPFAYVANKLFLCRPSHYQAYFSSVASFLDGRGEDPSFALYRRLAASGEETTRNFFGSKVIIAA